MSDAQAEFNELMRDKGRRAGHPEDDADGRSFLNISDDDDDDNENGPVASDIDPDTEAPRVSTSTARHIIPSRRFGANTGPKGVISDAQDFRDSRRVHRVSVRNLADLSSHTQSISLAQHARHLPHDEEEHDLEEEDDEFMEKWRQSRISELQTRPRESKMHLNGTSRRLYGGLTAVDGDGYLDAVDNSGPNTVVVVYIYDDFSQVSDLFEACVRTLAGKHQDTRFVKMHHEDAQMEPAGVPAVIAYRDGDKFAALVPVVDELPDDADLSALSLERLFQRHQILR